ncbi:MULTISPECIES: dihydroorotase [Prochlorococcus]|uniref:dihydroorotase n=1 Tax=Prochlorococcus TaxID=1218 RepID=UPI001267E09D|nr:MULTISPECIES: dihydroorotase [Prochlorococcus]
MSILLSPVKILLGAKESLFEGTVLICDNEIRAFGDEAHDMAKKLRLKKTPAKNKILAPCLVDPHSTLEDPLNGLSETLTSLKSKAAIGGYGQIGLLPKGNTWRDKPEHLSLGLTPNSTDVLFHLWGSLSLNGKGQELSPHRDLLKFGAKGFSCDDYIPPIEFIKKVFLLGEIGKAPVLIAPRDKAIQGNGILRESVETLRLGFHLDPVASETIPLGVLLDLQRQHPEINLRLMNLSTAEGVAMLARSLPKPMASVSWWHLLSDSSKLGFTSTGLRVCPSLGDSEDRNSLIRALKENTLTGVAVHAIPLMKAESKKPADQRLPGVTGHHLVLPSLWEELIQNNGWSVEELWQVLSFGPSEILALPTERLKIGSNRWLLFDPAKNLNKISHQNPIGLNSNEPLRVDNFIGGVEACGLIHEQAPF